MESNQIRLQTTKVKQSLIQLKIPRIRATVVSEISNVIN